MFRKLIGIAVLGVLLAAGLAPRASAEELTPQLDDLVEHFLAVVFGQEYAGAGQAQTVLARWDRTQTVGIITQGRKTQELINMAARRVRAVAKLTGVKFRTIQPGTPGPSIDLLFLRRAEMGNIGGPNIDQGAIRALVSDPTMRCFFLKWQLPPEKIVKAIVVVNVDLDPVEIDSCLLEELTQVMGLPNDDEAYWTTLFNPLDTSLSYSPWDELYLRTLYGPQLKAGMTPAQVRQAVRPVFADALSKFEKKP